MKFNLAIVGGRNLWDSYLKSLAHKTVLRKVRITIFCDFVISGDATVTIAHRCTPKEQLKELTSLADIIIAAAGNYTRGTIRTHACLSILLQFQKWLPEWHMWYWDRSFQID